MMQLSQLCSMILRWIGKRVPDVKYIRAIPNILLRPINNYIGSKDQRIVNVLGFKMALNPKECVDIALFLSPQLYDHKEITFIHKKFSNDCVFLDIGANIGFWSLYFSYFYPKARIISIEANPITFDILKKNININNFNISAFNVGVADKSGTMSLYCNNSGNRGGDTFVYNSANRDNIISVNVKTLFEILLDAKIEKIDVMKMDIEGMELIVLRKFFSEARPEIWPRFICLETSHDDTLRSFIIEFGYRVIFTTRENAIFER